jgi:hypothetical protein
MRAFAIVLAVVTASALAGCGKNECEKAADLASTATDSYCSGKEQLCWFCKCWSTGLPLGLDSKSCTVPIVASSAAVSCDGSLLTGSDQCLTDQAACTAQYQAAAKLSCDGSPE